MAEVGAFLSLAEAQLLTRTEDLIAGVVKELVREGGIIDRFPVKTLSGARQITYNRQNALPGGQFHAIADTWTPTQDIDVTAVSVSLVTFGDEKDYPDNQVRASYSGGAYDLDAIVLEQTLEGLKNRIENEFIYGSGTAPEISGLYNLATSNQTQNAGSGSTGAAATVTLLNRMLGMVRPKADILLGPYRLMQRIDQLNQGVNAAPLVYMPVVDGKGMHMSPRAAFFGEVEMVRSDYMATAETGVLQETIASATYSAETGGATGSFLGIHFGIPEKGQVGGAFLLIAGNLFDVEGPHPQKGKDAPWMRVTCYLNVGLAGTRGLGALDGCTDVAITA